MGDITGANAILTITIAQLFPITQQIQGFAADDVFDLPRIAATERSMGVDGILSAGMVFVEIPWEIALQADSPSAGIFDVWYASQIANRQTYPASGQIKITAIGKKYNLVNGFLGEYKPGPGAKRLLQPLRHTLNFNSIIPAPA